MRCSSLIKSCVLWLALAAGVQAQEIAWPASAQLVEQVGTLLEQRLGAPAVPLLGSHVLTEAHQVERFYRQRRFRPAWFDGAGVSLNAGELLQVLRRAEEEGLSAAAYPLALIERHLYGPIREPLQLAELELLLSDSFLRYVREVRSGRFHPATMDPDWRLAFAPVDPLPWLQEAVATNAFHEVLRAAPPAHPAYRQLRAALAQVRARAADGEWPILPPGPSLRSGMRDGRVVLLRERLHAGGDLAASAVADPELYDDALVQAVLRFQRRHGLLEDGIVGAATRAALNVSREQRMRQIEASMERWRWMPPLGAGRHLLINTAGFEAQLMEDGTTLLPMRVIIGTRYRQTPSFSSALTAVTFNPYWHVPRTIFREDILPQLRQDVGYLARKQLRVFQVQGGARSEVDGTTIDWHGVDGNRSPYLLRQEPGPHNSLGRIKFVLDNPYDIYLHDTPYRELFNAQVRAFSSGCIRLEQPLALAELLLDGAAGWDRAGLEAAIATERTRTVALARPLPVHLVYLTAWVDGEGELHLRPDIYGRDQRLLQALRREMAAGVASGEKNQ